MSWREYRELKLLWAERQAIEHNAWFLAKPAYVAGDFMDPASRQRRAAEAEMNALNVDRANAKLAKIKPGVKADQIDDLPDWAKG